jgi:hypothetical protein
MSMSSSTARPPRLSCTAALSGFCSISTIIPNETTVGYYISPAARSRQNRLAGIAKKFLQILRPGMVRHTLDYDFPIIFSPRLCLSRVGGRFIGRPALCRLTWGALTFNFFETLPALGDQIRGPPAALPPRTLPGGIWWRRSGSWCPACAKGFPPIKRFLHWHAGTKTPPERGSSRSQSRGLGRRRPTSRVPSAARSPGPSSDATARRARS